jgi:hypothetical protein
MERSAEIRLTPEGYVIDLYEHILDGKILRESRAIPGKNMLYAEEVVENWRNGIIQL